jgi:hypothetical protein
MLPLAFFAVVLRASGQTRPDEEETLAQIGSGIGDEWCWKPQELEKFTMMENVEWIKETVKIAA